MKRLLFLSIISIANLAMPPAPLPRFNVPSLKFLAAREVASHALADEFGQVLNSYDTGFKKLPAELQEYVEFMIRTKELFKKKLQSEIPIEQQYAQDAQEMLDVACASYTSVLDERLLLDIFAFNSNLNLNGNDHKFTPLMWVARQGKKSATELLIEHGADVNFQPQPGYTPVMAIARAPEFNESHLDILQLLIEKRVAFDVATSDGDTPLLNLCCLSYKEDRNQIDPIRIKLIDLLLRNGANVNHTGENNYTPVMYAARHKNTVILSALLNYKPNLELVTAQDITAFIIATIAGNTESLILLKNAGANINHRPAPQHYVHSALSYATEVDSGLLAALLALGIDTEIPDSYGKTALIRATENSKLTQVLQLLVYGADVNAVDNWQNTPLMIALEKENYIIAKYLLDHSITIVANSKIYNFSSGLSKLLKTNRVEILQEMMNKGLSTLLDENPSWRHTFIENAKPEMQKVLINYRHPEHLKSAWHKKLLFEAKRFSQDHKQALVLTGAAVTTAAVGAGIWYCLKNKEAKLIQ